MRPYKDGQRTLLDVQTVIPLPEAEDYQVRIREKLRKERTSRSSGKDLTKFEIMIEGEPHGPLSKRQAIFLVVKRLSECGVSPKQIHEVLSWRKNGLWRVAEGDMNSEEFEEQLSHSASEGGLSFEPPRWFYADDQLIKSEGKTWAFTKMWGARTEEGIMSLLEAFPECDIEYRAIPR